MLTFKRLAVVIINYRRPGLVIDCLKSIAGELDPERDVVVVVENGSDDGSAAKLERDIVERGWEDWVLLVLSGKNGGFSAGNNLGIQSVDAEAYLLLNSDTIMRPGAIATLLDTLERYPDVGIVSPRLEWPDETPQTSVFRYPTPASELIHSACTGPVTTALKRYEVARPISDVPIDFEWTSFACVLVRRAVFYDIGFLDTDYFMYYEDVDYCRRAREAGWRTLHWPEARVVHLRGGTSPVKALTASRKRRPYYYYAARSRYFAKHYGRKGLCFANVLWTVGRGISLFREWVQRKEAPVCAAEWRDIWTNFLEPLKAYSIENGVNEVEVKRLEGNRAILSERVDKSKV